MVVVRPDQYVAHVFRSRRRPKFLPSSQISCFRCSDAINRADRYFASGQHRPDRDPRWSQLSAHAATRVFMRCDFATTVGEE